MTNLLNQPVTVLKGVGEKTAQALGELGIHSLFDVMTHFPFRYEDLSLKRIEDIQDKEKTAIKGIVIAEPVVTHFGYRKSRLNFRVSTEEKVIVPITFFNQPYLKNKIKTGEQIIIQGTWDARYLSMTGMKIIAMGEMDALGKLEPVYPANKKVKQHVIIKLIEQAYQAFKAEFIDLIPTDIMNKYQLLHFSDAVGKMHFPMDVDEFKQARRTLVFEELFIYQMRMQNIRRKQRQLNSGTPVLYNVDELKAFISSLPFELTNAQKRSINELCRDIRKPIQMSRLLQGDVGSGKTVVAASLLFAVFSAGMQGALMAPTEILAEQHMHNLSKLFEPFNLKLALLTGSLKPKEKKELYEQIKAGEINIVIGTHALIQDQVEFKNLGLAITDEQHRFGVNQRNKLAAKGNHTDVLSMTATPIPRTLAITVYGEMDVSTLDELPAGRKPIKTNWVRQSQENTVIDLVRKQLEEKSQVYVVSPLIEESEKMDLKNVTDLKDRYAEMFEPRYRVGLLHGQLSNEEKEDVMKQFKNHDLDILVSTTVIEVGVDVPNATLMIIYDADRFGLAQLHQLRGRVGRGAKESACILIAEAKTEIAKERMNIMTQTNDGFLLSEKDLELRGPGDLFGKKQSGLPDFKVADVIIDRAALEVAREEAIKLIISDEFYTDSAYTDLRKKVGIRLK